MHLFRYYMDPISGNSSSLSTNTDSPNIHSVKISQIVYGATVESVKLVATAALLNFLFESIARTSLDRGFTMIVVAPIFEETICRGLIQRGIGFTQITWHYYCGKEELTSEDLKTQQIFRIRLTSLLFASMHLVVPHPNYYYKAVQIGWTFMIGLTYGHLTEKYSTLSVPMIAHGINNALVFSTISRTYVLLKLIALPINQLFWHYLSLNKNAAEILSSIRTAKILV